MSLTRLASPHLLSLGTALALGLATTSLASAQSLEEEQQAEAVASPRTTSALDSPVTDEQNHELSDDQTVLEERVGVERVDEFDPTERADTDYFFFGAIARGVIVPEFIQGLFVQTASGVGSSTPVNLGVGAYFNYRRNGFNITAEAWYLGFGTTGYYRGLGALDTEFERIESSLGVVFGSFLFGWSFDITHWLAIDLGIGLGVGGVVGDMYRTEAHRGGDRSGELRACSGPTDSSDGLGYCEDGIEQRGPNGRVTSTTADGGTYQQPGGGPGNGPNPFYFGDGGVPPIFAWLDLPRVGIRIKPIRQVQIRLDGGYNLYGFNFGGSLGYGF